jgi:hypothetical protein
VSRLTFVMAHTGGFTVQGWGGSYLVGPGMAQVSQLVQSTLQEAAASGE